MKVYMVGSHSSGKTTLAKYVSQKYKLPMITEVARSVLAEMETTLRALRTDIQLVNRYQRLVFDRQVQAEQMHKGSFVSDRAFDNLAYAAEHTTISAVILESAKFKKYMRALKTDGKVFFIRPHKNLLHADGVREALDWDSVVRIDGMIKLLLEQHRIPYLPIETASMQERCGIVDYVLRATGR